MNIIIAAISFIVLDYLWIGKIANRFYLDTLGPILRLSPSGALDPRLPAALVVYIALVTGIIVFVLPRAQGNPWAALAWGALFGFVSYATYDFTNLAVLAHWPLKTAIIDTLWGMIICGLTSIITVALPKLWQ